MLWSSMSGLAVGASTNIYVTNKVTGDCEPAVNNANLSSVVDQSGKSVPNAQSSTSITNLGASISGTDLVRRQRQRHQRHRRQPASLGDRLCGPERRRRAPGQ